MGASLEGLTWISAAPDARIHLSHHRSKTLLRRLGLWPTLAFALLAFLGVSSLETFSIDPGKPAAILFSDSTTADQAFAHLVAAGGLPIRPARSALGDGIVWIAAAGSPDFFARVKASGAWVINPLAFGGCFLVKSA